MARKAPGKHYRKGITLIEVMRMFPDDATAEKCFETQRWPERNLLPPLRLHQCSGERQAQDHGPPLP